MKSAMVAYRTKLPGWIPKPGRGFIRFAVGFVTGMYANQNFELPPIDDPRAISRFFLDSKPKSKND